MMIAITIIAKYLCSAARHQRR